MARETEQTRLSLWLGGAVFALTLLTGFVLTGISADRLEKAVASERAGLLDAAGGLMQQSLQRALEHDLPLQDLPGIGDYLEDLRQRLPGITAIELSLGTATEPSDEWLTFRSGEAEAGDLIERRRPDLPGTSAELRFHRAAAGLATGQPADLAVIAALAALAGLLAGAGYYLTTGRALDRADQRLQQRLAALALGDFRHEAKAPAGALPPDQAFGALQAQLEPLSLRHSLLLEHAEGLRAIDHDGRLSAQVGQVMDTLPAEWRFGEARRRGAE